MSLLTVEEVEARVATGLDSDTTQTVIDQQEAWLAGKIGALVDERTLTFRPSRYGGPLYINRPADAVTVEVNGVSLDEADYRMTGTQLTRLPLGAAWAGVVTVTFSPNDEPDVKAALIELVRLAVTESPYSSESGESRRGTMMASFNRQRAQIARILLPNVNRGPMSVPMR